MPILTCSVQVLHRAAPIIFFWGPLPALQAPPLHRVPPQKATSHEGTHAGSLPSPTADTDSGTRPCPPASQNLIDSSRSHWLQIQSVQ